MCYHYHLTPLFLAAITKSVSTFATINKHLLRIEAGTFKPEDAYLDGILWATPAGKETHDIIIDNAVGEAYDRLMGGDK